MKKIIILVALFWVFCAQAQTTIRFNKRQLYGCVNNTIFTGIQVTDSCYYVMGNAREDSTCIFGSLFLKVDTFGNGQMYKVTPSVETWFSSFQKNSENNFVNLAHVYDSVGLRGGVFEYDNQGNVIKKIVFDNSLNIGIYVNPEDVVATVDSGYLTTSYMGDSAHYKGDIHHIKFDKNGQEEWRIERYYNNNLSERNAKIFYDRQAKSYTIAFQQDNIIIGSYTPSVRCRIEHFDSTGRQRWTWASPQYGKRIYGANDFTRTKDGGWLVASAKGNYTRSTGGRIILSHNPYIFKLDSARNLLWEHDFFTGNGDRTKFNKVIELEDSSIVVFGNQAILYPDTINPQYSIEHGKIVKMTPNGQIIWDRLYEYLTNRYDQHIINDAAVTPDGGFIACGEVRAASASTPGASQQGWLLKLDEYGCLVPGCQLAAGVLPLSATGAAIELRLFPNPTTQFLNVYHDGEASGEAVIFRIVNIQGQEVQQYATQSGSHKTYMLGVEELPVGVYVLTMYLDGELVGSEQFVKQ